MQSDERELSVYEKSIKAVRFIQGIRFSQMALKDQRGFNVFEAQKSSNDCLPGTDLQQPPPSLKVKTKLAGKTIFLIIWRSLQSPFSGKI